MEMVGALCCPSMSGVPGATSLSSKACRANDNSPNASPSPDCPLAAVDVALGTGLQLRVPLSSREYIKPFTEFLFRDQPSGSRCNNIRGIKRKSFHPLSWRTTSSLDASSNANRKAFLNGSLRQWGTLFITEACFFNLSVRFHSSTRTNASLRTAGRGGWTSMSLSTSSASASRPGLRHGCDRVRPRQT